MSVSVPSNKLGVRLRRCAVRTLCSVILLWSVSPAWGDPAWEIAPYRCQVWVMMGPHPTLSAPYQQHVRQQVSAQLQASFGGAWELRVEDAPPAAQRHLRQSAAAWHKMDWLSLAPESVMPERDKLFLVRVEGGGRGYTLTTTEVDTAARRVAEAITTAVPTAEGLPAALTQRIVADFTPLASIHRVDGNQVELRCRASELIAAGNTLAEISEGSYLQPILIPKNPYGQVRVEGIRIIPWTVLEVLNTTEHRLTARLHTAFGQPLRARRSRRHEQLAQVLKVRLPATTIKMETREAQPRPLVGYELLAEATDMAAEGALPQPGARVGESDQKGEVRVPRGDQGLQHLLVRHGMRILVRVPLVAGASGVEALSLQDDDDRLEVEGFVQGVMDHLIDTVAQRQLLTLRIRRHLEAGEYDSAQAWIEALRKLESRSEFLERVQRRQRMLAGGNREMQTRAIDKLFGETRVLFDNYLDPLLPQRLQDELRARQAADKDAARESRQRKEPTEVGSPS